MSDIVKSQLAPHGVLRAAINMGNFLLVTGKTASGDPDGVSPDMARAIAERLGVPVKFVPYAKPSDLADAAGTDTWDIGNIGAEPQRAMKIAFTAAYAEIEATYLVPAGSTIQSIADVDKKGNRISVSKGSAYELWLERNIHHAELVRAPSIPAMGRVAIEPSASDVNSLNHCAPRGATSAATGPGAPRNLRPQATGCARRAACTGTPCAPSRGR